MIARSISHYFIKLTQILNHHKSKSSFNLEYYSLIIERQLLDKGETTFKIKDLNTLHTFDINAKKFYQNHEVLLNLNKKDLITVISTAVQEQTFLDFQKMNGV